VVHLFYSAGCKHQAYIYKDRVLALQFHLETTTNSLNDMIEHGRQELKPARFIQTEKELLSNNQLTESNRKVLFKLLDRLASGHPWT
jgi:hypothetical protein